MTPRWSRLALAACLAFGAFGVYPTVDVASAAAADDAACDDCACDEGHREAAAAPSLVVDIDHAVCRGHARFDRFSPRERAGAAPLCAVIAPAIVAPTIIATPIADARVSAVERGPRHAPWRLAPKTSPPVR